MPGAFNFDATILMRAGKQIAIIGLICMVVVPLSAHFVPGVRPWLDRVWLLQPLTALGLVPDAAKNSNTRGSPADSSKTNTVSVVASRVSRQPLVTVISAIGTARGVQAVDLSFEVSGRLTSIAVAPGDHVNPGDLIAKLDDEAAQLGADRAQLVLEAALKNVARSEQLAQSGAATALQRQDAELALRTAELAVQSAKRDLENHSLLAPIAGYVGLIEPQTGDLVSPTITIGRIEDRSGLIVDFRVPEKVAALVAVGNPVHATPVSQPGQPIQGRIIAVDNRVDEASRTLRVQASIDNDGDALRSGMAFEITIDFEAGQFPALDPLSIQWGDDGAYVWVVRQAKAVRLPIRILQRNAGAVLVEAVFDAGDLVVTEGVQALRPSADVTVVAPKS